MPDFVDYWWGRGLRRACSVDPTATVTSSSPTKLVVSTVEPPAKVKPTIKVKTKKKIEVGTRPKMKVVVSAPGVTPSGKVTVKVKSGKKTKTYRVMLNEDGKAKLKLKRAKQHASSTQAVTIL